MKILKFLNILWAVGFFIIPAVYSPAQNTDIGFSIEKRCQHEVIIKNLSDYDAYVWEVFINGNLNPDYTSVVFEPVYTFEGLSNETDLVEIKLTAFDFSHLLKDSITQPIELIFRPEINLQKTNSVICSFEYNVMFWVENTEGYNYAWNFKTDASINLDDVLVEQINPMPYEVVTSWKNNTEVVQEVEVVLTLSSNNPDDPMPCEFEYKTQVLIIPNQTPESDTDSLWIVRKAPTSNIILCINSNPAEVFYKWGYNSKVIKTDTLPYHEYDSIDGNLDYWVLVLNRSYSSCSTDTLRCDLTKSLELNQEVSDRFVPEITLYPNPTNNHFYIKAGNFRFNKIDINIKDQLGKNVWSDQIECYEMINEKLITFPQIIKGVYFTELILDNKYRTVKKIIVY